MATWKVYAGPDSTTVFESTWLASAKREASFREITKSVIEVDDSQLGAFLNALKGVKVASINLQERFIVLPAPIPGASCPTCGGTGKLK